MKGPKMEKLMIPLSTGYPSSLRNLTMIHAGVIKRGDFKTEYIKFIKEISSFIRSAKARSERCKHR